MKRKKIILPRLRRYGRSFWIVLSAAPLVLASCALPSKEAGKESLRIASWNLQTFFDANFDGNEYEDFKNERKGWSLKRYEERLDRLAEVIKELDADVFVMEELEKKEQLYDISNRLSGNFDFSKTYKYALFVSDEGSSIGCAVLSRFPLTEPSSHEFSFLGGKKQPSMRPIIQATISVKEKSLILFVNHWKSKSGGAESSEFWRKRQESVLAQLMAKANSEGKPALATGDFNKDISEFDSQSSSKKNSIVLRGKNNIEVHSPWLSKDGEINEKGSYRYKDEWERIDHFFSSGDIELQDFRVETEGKWANKEKHPLRYQLWNGKGYSDHLPISCAVKF